MICLFLLKHICFQFDADSCQKCDVTKEKDYHLECVKLNTDNKHMDQDM